MAAESSERMNTAKHQQITLHHALSFFNKNPTVQFLHYHWTDMSGILRVRVLTKGHSLKLASEDRPFKSGTWALIGLMPSSSMPDGFRPGSTSSLWPDWTSIRLLQPGHASVFCNVSEESASHIDVNLSKPFQRCPRSVLHSLLERARIENRLSFKLGFELEFYLMSDVDLKNGMENSAPEAYSRWSTASAMRDVRATCLEACVLALQDAGIDVEQFHAETGRHMYEIATGPLPALAAIDTYNQSREIVKRMALKHGFQATFLPKPFSTLQCLGQHIHISMHEEGGPVEGEMSRQDWFLAGMLHRLPLLCAYGMPSKESFQRFELFALAPWVSWGTENKDAPIRKIKDGHWELRTIDGTANVYLVAAAFIAAGILGLREQQPLKWKDNRDFLQRLDTEAKEKLGIDTLLPESLEQALSLCKSDVMGLDLLLGKQVLEYYVMVKEHEQLKLASLSEMERKRLFYDSF